MELKALSDGRAWRWNGGASTLCSAWSSIGRRVAPFNAILDLVPLARRYHVSKRSLVERTDQPFLENPRNTGRRAALPLSGTRTRAITDLAALLRGP
jgi:hypothetical protein